MIEPSEKGGDYVTVVTLDNYQHYRHWEESHERHQLLEQTKEISAGDIRSEQFVGLYHFLGNRDKRWPPDWRMVIIAYFAIWPDVVELQPLLF